MWMKAQAFWATSGRGIGIGIAVLLVLLLLVWLLRRRRRERADAPLRVIFPSRATPPPVDADADTEAMALPDWLQPRHAAPPAPSLRDAALDAASAEAQEIAPVVAPGPAMPPPPATPAVAAAPGAVFLPDWKTDPAKGATPLNLRGPATAALLINGSPVVPTAPAPAPVPAAPAERAPSAAPMAAASASPAPVPLPPVAPEQGRQGDFARARTLLGQDRPREALALLEPLLSPDASAEAWAVAGWCHWKLAHDLGDPQAAPAAARAFERAIAADASRALPLARMIGRCHLLQATTDAPERRPAHVAEAVRVYEAHFVGAARLSPSAVLEWAEALLEMARLVPPAQQTMWLGRLDAVSAAAKLEDTGLAPRWHRLRAAAAALRARHATTPAEHARLLRAASAELQAGSVLIEDTLEREQWLAEWIDAERQPLASGSTAARIAGYQALERRMQPALANAASAAPLLAWVRVLADWAELLDGPAARQRLASTATWFDRIDRLGDLDATDRAFTRAYYLRLRARHEHGAARGRTLDEAARLLSTLAAPGQPRDPAVAMEQAEIALARAALLPADAAAHYAEAIAHAALAADHQQTRLPGFRALLAALLDWQQLAPDAPRLAQIGAAAQWLQAEDQPPCAATLRLLARAALAAGDTVTAAERSARAWQAGIDDPDILACWQQADAQWARELVHGGDRAAWERQHRLLRLAGSTA